MVTKYMNQQVGLTQIDYDLHGIVGIRVINATKRDATIIERQLGPIRSILEREPDITIRFVDQLHFASRIRYLGLDDVGFTDDAFLVLRGKDNANIKVQIPIDQIGQPCEIICEHDIPKVPLLIAIINLTALNKGILPLHAAAFTYNGCGVLATGWSKGGKTESLLAFAGHGATYIGDEWVYLDPESKAMYGIPEQIKVWEWHLEHLPEVRKLLYRSDRIRLQTLKRIVQMMEAVAKGSKRRRSAVATLFQRLSPLVKQQLFVQMPPQQLFGQKLGTLAGKLDKVIFVMSHEPDEIIVEPIAAEEVAERMVFSLLEERMDLLAYYRRFQFAFPTAHNELIEQAEERQRALLARALADKEAYVVYHPYPVTIPLLFDAISPLL